MYATPTFIAAAPALPSLPTTLACLPADTPRMIVAPKRRGRPATKRASLRGPTPSRHPPPPSPPPQPHPIDVIIPADDEAAAIAMLNDHPHMLVQNPVVPHPKLASPKCKSPPKPKRKRVASRDPQPDQQHEQFRLEQPNHLSPQHSPHRVNLSRDPPLPDNTPTSPVASPVATATPSPVPPKSKRTAKKKKKQSATDGQPDPTQQPTPTQGAADNTVRWYLQLIGGDRLLRAEEEVSLGRQIRHLMQWQRKLLELADSIGREPTQAEWADYLEIDHHEFAKRLNDAKRAKDRMIVCNLRLVVSIAKRYLNRGMPLSDLIQEGTLGLIRACEKFDAEKGFKFSTYATWWVRQAVTRSIADQSRTIRLPVPLYDTITAIRRATKFLTNELGRPPLEQEIADYCKISVEKLRMTRVNMQAALPLDCPLSSSDDALTLSDVIESAEESPEDRVESSLLRDDLEHVVNSLTPCERDVVRMRYGLDDGRAKTLEEIGRVFDVTKERVRQIKSKALRKLRHPYRSAVLREYTPPEL